MKNQNAIILFARTPEIVRSGGGDPFAALPWDDLDSIFHACVGDLLLAAASVPDSDVLLYRSPHFPSEKLMVPAGNGIRMFDMAHPEFGESVQQAVDGAFLEFYHRVLVVLENNPLLGRNDFRSAADQLGVEDDCAVITPADGNRIVLAALKTNYPSLFAARGASGTGRQAGVLNRLCEMEAMVFPTRPSFALDTTANIERLRVELSARDPGTPDYPRRTGAIFKTLEKKYKWRRTPR